MWTRGSPGQKFMTLLNNSRLWAAWTTMIADSEPKQNMKILTLGISEDRDIGRSISCGHPCARKIKSTYRHHWFVFENGLSIRSSRTNFVWWCIVYCRVPPLGDNTAGNSMRHARFRSIRLGITQQRYDCRVGAHVSLPRRVPFQIWRAKTRRLPTF